MNTKLDNYLPARWLSDAQPKFIYCLLLSGLILLTGCQATPNATSLKLSDYQFAIQEHKFQHAQTLLNKQIKHKQLTDRELQERRGLLAEADRHHTAIIIKQAMAKINAYHWQEAETLLLQAEQHSIHPEAFSTTFKELFEKEQNQLANLSLNTKMAKMVWLKAEASNLDNLNHSTLQSPLSRFSQLRIKLITRHTNRALMHCAKENFDSNHINRSRTCYSYIDKENIPPRLVTEYQILSHYFAKHKPANPTAIAAIKIPPTSTHGIQALAAQSLPPTEQQTLSPEAIMPSPKPTINKQTQLKKLLQRLESDLENVNLVKIQTTLGKIDALKLNTPQPHKKALLAKQFLSSQITKLDQRADNFYRNEHISQAHSIWEYLLRVDPNNSSIRLKQDRSQRVLENMRALREEQPRNSLADAIEAPS